MIGLNRYAMARRESETHGDFLDLINTNFHSCCFIYPCEPLLEATSRYYAEESSVRYYTPVPQGDQRLREAIARFYAGADLKIGPENVLVTASASECYSHMFAALCTAGDAALLPRPGYPLFEDIARRSGVDTIFYDQSYESEWQIDTDQVALAVSPRTRLLIIISPNNPTGAVIDIDTAKRLLAICSRRGLIMVVDEVFSDFLHDGAELVRPAALDSDVAVLTINGASKLFASPDIKVSWMCATGPKALREEIVDLLATQNDLFLSSSSLSQLLVTTMLGDYPEFTRSTAREISRRRNIFLSALESMPDVTVIPPAGGIHLPLVFSRERIPEWIDDESLAVTLLSETHIATHPGYLYGFREDLVEDPVLVTSFLPPPDVLCEGALRINTFLSELSR